MTYFIVLCIALVSKPMVQVRPRAAAQSGTPAAASVGNESSKDALLATYKLLEKALQTGDGNLYLSLHSQVKLDQTDKQAQERFRKGFPADPSVRYEVIAVKIRSDHAAVLGKVTYSRVTVPQYYLAKFVLEKGSWKIAEDELRDKPIGTAALEAAVPAKDGAFTRAGSPWSKIPYSTSNTKWFKENEIGWKIQAIQDESFLYIRFGGKVELPPPGTELPAADAKALKGIPSTPDVFVIRAPNGNEYQLMLSANPLTRATFDESGHATSNRYFVEYSLAVRNAADEMLFSNGTRDSFEPLITVQDRFLDVKIPLKSLGGASASAGIEIREANSLAKILPYRVMQFSQ